MLKELSLGISFCLLVGTSCAQQQTCYTSVVETTPTVQFTPIGNGTVLDTKTNLIWKRCSEGQTWNGTRCLGGVSTFTWQEALDFSQNLNTSGGFAGQTDWRVPNIKELGSIVEMRCFYPAINLTVFPDTTTFSPVWSSSPDMLSVYGNKAWYFGMVGGSSDTDDTNNRKHIRLVRNES